MARYIFVLDGDRIHIERGDQIPFCGFVAARIVRAKSEQEAQQRITIELLKEWKQLFNQNNRAGTPRLSVHHGQRILNPFKRLKLANEFLFYCSDDEKTSQLNRVIKSCKRWFSIRW